MGFILIAEANIIFILFPDLFLYSTYNRIFGHAKEIFIAIALHVRNFAIQSRSLSRPLKIFRDVDEHRA
jgi:hypothetical protein